MEFDQAQKRRLVDAKRGKAFTKLIKEITIAARLGGGDLNANPRLPHRNHHGQGPIDAQRQHRSRNKKSTGELGGGHLEQIAYEGYGPGWCGPDDGCAHG